MNNVKVKIAIAASILQSDLSVDDLEAVGEYSIDINSNIDKQNWANVALDVIAVEIPMPMPEYFEINVFDANDVELEPNSKIDSYTMDKEGFLK